MQTRGNGHVNALHFHHTPQRIVSLVPSMTESLFDLGFGGAVVGITDYCIHPAEALAHLPRLGGPKNPNVEAILDLRPDLVLANWEENRRQSVEALEAHGVAVWVTFPKTVRQAVEVLWTLTGLFHSQEAAIRLQTLELTLEWAAAAAANQRPVRYFCPIWYDLTRRELPWYMSFNQHTYSHDLLQLLGGDNICARRERRYPLEADLGLAAAEDPGERDTRFPRLTLDEVHRAEPELILLPDEPFNFDEDHRQWLCAHLPDSLAVKQEKVYLVEGSLITWHGTRLARALQDLPGLLHP